MGLRYYENAINKSHISHPYPSTGAASIGQRAPDDILASFGAATPIDASLPTSEVLAELEGDGSTDPQQLKETRLYDILATPGPGVFHIVVFTADRLGTETDLGASLVKEIEHYQRVWSSRWPGLGGVLDVTSGARTAVGVTKSKSTPQFMVHVISTATPSYSSSSSSEHATAMAVADRTEGYGKMYVDLEGGRLHEWFGFTGLASSPSSPQTKKTASLVQGGGIVVLRPDAHVAFRVRDVGSAAWADVDEYFVSLLTSS